MGVCRAGSTVPDDEEDSPTIHVFYNDDGQPLETKQWAHIFGALVAAHYPNIHMTPIQCRHITSNFVGSGIDPSLDREAFAAGMGHSEAQAKKIYDYNRPARNVQVN